MKNQKNFNHNHNNLDDSDKFYAEMDRQKIHQSCCTCQTLVLLFSVFLIVLIVGAFYLYRQITVEKIFDFKIPTVSLEKINEKLNNLTIDESGQAQIILTDEEMSALFTDGLNWQNFILREIQVQTWPTEMLIYGQLIKPLKSKIVISTMPQVKDGKLDFKVTGLTAGDLNFPNFINEKIGQSMSDLINTRLTTVYQVMTVTEVNLEEGRLILKGKVK